MALNPTTSSNSWNYSNPDNPGYSTELVGTVVAIQEVQAMNFGPGGKPTTPKFWDNGNPVWNIRMAFCGPNGGLRTWTFQPASKAAREGKKASIHLDLYQLAGGVDLMNLIGKTLRITTQEGKYGLGNPRPWAAELLEDVEPYELSQPLDEIFKQPKLFANQAVSGGAVQQQAPQQQYAPQPQQYAPQPQMAPPAMPQQPMQQSYAQPQLVPQMAPQPAYAPQPQYATQPQQPYTQEVYDDLPF